MTNLTPEELDIQIAGARILDYIRDLLLIAGHCIEYDKKYLELRNQFGYAIVQLIQVIKENK